MWVCRSVYLTTAVNLPREGEQREREREAERGVVCVCVCVTQVCLRLCVLPYGPGSDHGLNRARPLCRAGARQGCLLFCTSGAGEGRAEDSGVPPRLLLLLVPTGEGGEARGIPRSSKEQEGARQQQAGERAAHALRRRGMQPPTCDEHERPP